MVVEFARAFPDRFFDFGVAEQNMMGAAAGLALGGKIPFVSTYSCFASMRACEQVRTDIAYNSLQVRIVATHAGISSGPAGPTHQGTEDMAIIRSFANMTVIAPADAVETALAVQAAVHYPGPIYLRLSRAKEPVVYETGYDFRIGRANMVLDGDHCTVIACGGGVGRAIKAAEQLAAEGVGVRVIDMHTIKPIDKEAILKAASETAGIVTVENHTVVGGLGGAVAEVLAQAGAGVPLARLGLPDVFSVIGPYDELMRYYGFDAEGIMKAVRELL